MGKWPVGGAVRTHTFMFAILHATICAPTNNYNSDIRLLTPDHHHKYNINEKVQNIVRITRV